MANWIKIIANKWTFKDSEQEVDLDSLAKGENSAHNTRHESGGDDEIDLTGMDGSGLAGIVTTTGVATLTNKRNTKRAYSTTSLATLTPEIDTYDIFSLTAQDQALNIANHSTSTPTAGECIFINITPDATPRALTYGTNYVAYSGVSLPTTTVASKRLQMLFIWLPVGKYTLAWAGPEA